MTEQTQDKYMLRLPDGMREQIKAEAERNGRSMNSEVIHRLQSALPQENEVRITLRIPADLHGVIISSLLASGRSMNAEIISRLRKSYEAGDKNDLTTLLSRALTIAEAHGLGDLQWREIDIKRHSGE